MAILFLGKYNCEYNRVDKTNYTTYDNTQHDVTLLETGTDEDSYVFDIDLDMETMRQYNYCRIDGREYFIEPIQALNGGISRIKATIDVLMQNRSVIYNSEQLVERNAKHFNTYLRDPQKVYASYDTVDVLAFPNTAPSDSIILITCG